MQATGLAREYSGSEMICQYSMLYFASKFFEVIIEYLMIKIWRMCFAAMFTKVDLNRCENITLRKFCENV